MKQIEALQLVADEKALWLGMSINSQYRAYSGRADKTIPTVVWERLLELGDLDVLEAWGVNDKYLVLTEQGKQRLEQP